MTSGVTREQIRAAYVCLLAREPESDQAYAAHSSCRDLFQLRHAIMTSEEYNHRMSGIREAQDRQALFFIHLEKCGGTTLYSALASNFDPAQVSPPHYSFLQDYVMSETTYEFISGHFDYAAVLNTPRRAKRVISIFRDPVDRLKSQYRFWRSHPVPDDAEEVSGWVLAKKLSPEAFFSHPDVRASALIDNYYFRTFGVSPPGPISASLTGKEARDALDVAKSRIRSLDGIGLTHRMDESLALICAALGLRTPEQVQSLQVTDKLPDEDARFARVERVEVTPALRRMLADLVRHDTILFDLALAEFVQRLERSNAARGMRASNGFRESRV